MSHASPFIRPWFGLADNFGPGHQRLRLHYDGDPRWRQRGWTISYLLRHHRLLLRRHHKLLGRLVSCPAYVHALYRAHVDGILCGITQPGGERRLRALRRADDANARQPLDVFLRRCAHGNQPGRQQLLHEQRRWLVWRGRAVVCLRYGHGLQRPKHAACAVLLRATRTRRWAR